MQSLKWILWNLMLASISVPAGYLLSAGAQSLTIRKKYVPWIFWLPLAIFWIAFLPNTCYLLTEWRHFLLGSRFVNLRSLSDTDRSGLLEAATYGLFFMLYSGYGVLCFVLSIRPVEALLRKTKIHLLTLAPPFFLIISLGVYLGLIHRLNSWDLIHRPNYVFTLILDVFSNLRLLKTIVIFGAILWIVYETVDMWVDAFTDRLIGWGILPGHAKVRTR